MKRLMMIGMAAMFGLGMYGSVQAGDISAGKARYFSCVACHGDVGQGGGGGMYPALKGRDSNEIVQLLNKYRANQATGQFAMLMVPQAAGLSDEDIANLAAYIESL